VIKGRGLKKVWDMKRKGEELLGKGERVVAVEDRWDGKGRMGRGKQSAVVLFIQSHLLTMGSARPLCWIVRTNDNI